MEQDPLREGSLTNKILLTIRKRKGLKEDGVVTPGGETIRALRPRPAPRTVPPKAGAGAAVYVVAASAEAPDAKSPDNAQPGTRSPSWPTDDGQSVLFNKIRENLKMREGGFSNDPDDRGGPTMKGLSQKTLDEINERNPEWGLPKNSRDLTDEQIDGLFRSEYFDRPKIEKLAKIPGVPPQLVEQYFDAGVLQGSVSAGKMLQKSLDARLGTDLRVTRTDPKTGKVSAEYYDGIVGPDTRNKVRSAIDRKLAEAVNNGMVEYRQQFMRNLEDFKKYAPGWVPRAAEFFIPRRTSSQQ